MAQIAHPQTGDSIDVEIIDRESYRGTEVVQVEASEESVELSDQSGNAPWVEADRIHDDDDGLHQTPENSVALAEGRTPEEAERVRQQVESEEVED